MKDVKIVLLMSFVLCGAFANAQTQQGVVKTKGRMVNGKHVAGKGLSDATITIQDRSRVLSQGSGAFSFPVTNKTFLVQGVQKRGYQLVDADAAPKTYHYSPETLYLVMETPEQQAEDKLAAERKIRRTLQRQLQQREDELDELKEKLTQEEYHRRLAQLYEDQKNNEKLIADMAKEYSQIDYDQLDELNRQISDAILNGELTRADSLLRSKGDINSRIASVRKAQEAEAKEEVELAHRQENLAASKVGTKKRLEDLAQDCKNYFDRYKMSNQHDSATYYIELRAELDTTNAEWQFAAGYYLGKQNQHKKAIAYYEKTLSIYRCLVQANPQAYEPDIATTLNNLAILYSKTQRFSESESLFKEAQAIYCRLTQSNPQAYEPHVAMTLNNLAFLYSYIQRFTESEMMYKEALEIRRRFAQANPQAYEPDMARTLNNLADLYSNTLRFAESETMCKEALAIHRRLVQADPQAYEPDMARTLICLANLYYGTQRFPESEAMYKEALAVYRRLAQSNPQAYEPDVATTLNNLASLYSDTQCFSESEEMFKEALAIYRRLTQSNPQAYEPYMANTLNNLAVLYKDTQRFSESESMYKEALTLYRLSQANSQAYEPDVANTLYNLANLYLDIQRFSESGVMYKEVLAIYRRLAQSNPQVYEPDLASSLYNVGLFKVQTEQYADAISPFEDALKIYHRIAQINPVHLQAYENSLYWLSKLYPAVNNYISAYNINKEWLPIMKQQYEAEPDAQKEDYSGTLGGQSFYAIFAKQYVEAEQYAHEGLTVDSTKHFIYANLAAALLFQGKYTEAEKIYRQYKSELKEGFLDDFRKYAEAGVIPKKYEVDVEKIKKMLNE